MDTASTLDLLSPGEPTALVCFDVPEMQRLATDQLTELGYHVHRGLFAEDILLKLRAHTYEVVLLSEHFDGGHQREHPVLAAAIAAPAARRRQQFLVLLGASLRTADAMQAFSLSVDLVVALPDVVNLRPLLRRGVQRQAEFHKPLLATLERLAGEG